MKCVAVGETEASDKTILDDLSDEQRRSSALCALVMPGALTEDSFSRH